MIAGHHISPWVPVAVSMAMANGVGSAAAEAAADIWPAVRAYSEAQCGTELSRLLEVNKFLTNPWIGNRPIPAPEGVDEATIVPAMAWYSSTFVLAEENATLGKRTGEAPDDLRARMAEGLDAALTLETCLMPTDDVLAVLEAKRGKRVFQDFMTATCLSAPSAELVELLRSDLRGAALQERVDDVKENQTLACKRTN